jgi:hypothetical protein
VGKAGDLVVGLLEADASDPARVLDNRGESNTLTSRSHKEAGVDGVVIELGGDLVSANNPTILALPEIRDNVSLIAVICNDALGALGVKTLNQTRFRLPEQRFRYFTSPFRNHAGMSRRMASVGIEGASDPRAEVDVRRLAIEFARLVPTTVG